MSTARSSQRGGEDALHRGRFAPSPTGPLHFGSLVAAAGSYLQARALGGIWGVRMEDLDGPRNMPGAAPGILHTLEHFGFEWDGEVVYQSQRVARYREALEVLRHGGNSFPCACTRRMVGGGAYPGTCAGGIGQGRSARSVRLRVPEGPVRFNDAVAGPYACDVGAQFGHFVVLRADGIVAYHLATAVDDAQQQITQVVRGGDLLDSTPRQLLVLRALGMTEPSYAHLPVALNSIGRKLSKQTHAPPIDDATDGKARAALLARALDFLGHPPPDGLAGLDELWSWARTAWRLDCVPAPSAVAAATAPEGDEPLDALC